MTDTLDKANVVFANAMMAVANSKRYGLKSCAMPVDPFLAYDLLELYKWYKQEESCSTETEDTTCQTTCGCSQSCSLSSIEERIRTL